METLMTTKEVAVYLRVSRSQVYLLLKKKIIPHIRLSPRRLVVRQSDLSKWLETLVVKYEV